VPDGDLEDSRRLYTWADASKPQHCFENISLCRIVDDVDFTDGIVALFDDTNASECSHKRKPIDAARFNIHRYDRFIADCQATMHYVDLHVVDASGSQVLIKSFLLWYTDIYFEG